MTALTILEEFVGRFGISYKDGKTVYAYDEITCGLYKFELDLREVNLVLSFADICWGTVGKVRGISKKGNEIILIPSRIDLKWVFYNVIKGEVRYEMPVKEKICISDVITIDKTLFLIPADIYNPITVISLDNLKEVSLQNDWIDRDELKNGIYNIWGAVSYDHIIVFPIIGSKQIVIINNKLINVIKVEISHLILSVCVYGDKLWILPMSGVYVYMANFKGDILDRVCLLKEGMEISASDFVRVIAIEEYIFLLPAYKRNICVYECKRNRILQMEGEKTSLPGGWLRQSPPYWGVIIEDKRLHLLPSSFPYKRVDLASFEISECKLRYGDNIEPDVYWKMVAYTQKKNVFIERKERNNDLEEFLEFIDYSYKERSIESNGKIGEKIWGIMR